MCRLYINHWSRPQHNHSTEEKIEKTGHIVLRFTVNRYGMAGPPITLWNGFKNKMAQQDQQAFISQSIIRVFLAELKKTLLKLNVLHIG